MKTVIRRLHRLENRFVPQPNRELLRLADLLRERRRRRLEASGQPFHESPPLLMPLGPFRYMSSAETMRLCLSRMRERRRQQELEAGKR